MARMSGNTGDQPASKVHFTLTVCITDIVSQSGLLHPKPLFSSAASDHCHFLEDSRFL